MISEMNNFFFFLLFDHKMGLMVMIKEIKQLSCFLSLKMRSSLAHEEKESPIKTENF